MVPGSARPHYILREIAAAATRARAERRGPPHRRDNTVPQTHEALGDTTPPGSAIVILGSSRPRRHGAADRHRPRDPGQRTAGQKGGRPADPRVRGRPRVGRPDACCEPALSAPPP